MPQPPIPPTPPVTPEERRARLGHPGVVIWVTGLSGAGKTTLANAAERALFTRGCAVTVLDGDCMRSGLSSDLDFSLPARTENVRRMAEVARLFADAGLIVLVSAIAPMRADRERARALIGAERFVEVYCDCPLAVCEARDPKGLYRRARSGQIPDFTGVSSPYEPPSAPDLRVDSAHASVSAEVDALLAVLAARFGLPA
jgi:adenylyl-sulfate kinase